MGLVNLIFKNKGKVQVQTSKESQPLLPSFIILAAATQTFLALMLLYKFQSFIPIRHLLFCILYPTYLILANHFRFGNNIVIRQRHSSHPSNLAVVMANIYSEADTLWFMEYMAFATVIGVFLPLATMFLAPVEVAESAISPLVVLWTQITCETVAMRNPYVHRYIAFLITVGFSVCRQSMLFDWFSASLSNVSTYAWPASVPTSCWFGLALSTINVIFWTANTFGFILFRWAPELLSNEKCAAPEVEWNMGVPLFKSEQSLKRKIRDVDGEITKQKTARAA